MSLSLPTAHSQAKIREERSTFFIGGTRFRQSLSNSQRLIVPQPPALPKLVSAHDKNAVSFLISDRDLENEGKSGYKNTH